MDEQLILILARIAIALEKLSSTVDKRKSIRMSDIDRAKVYTKHLGERLRLADKAISIAEKKIKK